jgi:hypothetical protein
LLGFNEGLVYLSVRGLLGAFHHCRHPTAQEVSVFLPLFLSSPQTVLEYLSVRASILSKSVLILCLVSSTARSEIVINEVHYEPLNKLELQEFVEIFNSGPESVDLSNWSFTEGIEFAFPQGTNLEPQAYLVIAEHTPTLSAVYGAASIGPFGGSLSNDGERVELSDAGGDQVDAVDYRIQFPWPLDSSGQGSSMELLNPGIDNSLGGSWKASQGSPTPGLINSVFAENPPPQIRQVNHSPQQPNATDTVRITAKVTDPEGVAQVYATYQVVTPNNYIPAEIPLTVGQLVANPFQPRTQNPDFENPANWTQVLMRDDGTFGDEVAFDSIFTAELPPRGHRTLVRYRIEAFDRGVPSASVRAPFADDPSLNFAYFVYDGVPPYTPTDQTVHPEGLGHTYSVETLTSIPVYHLMTRNVDTIQCMAYDDSFEIPSSNRTARSAFNWEGAFIYDGVVYDHIRYRLRGHNQRYQLKQKRNMRFRFNRGHYFQAKDQKGREYPTQWRTLLFAKGYGPRNVGNFGLAESMNNFLFNLTGTPAPFTHFIHYRVLDSAEEAPMGSGGQYQGDFWGLFLAMEDYDSRFLDAHNLEKGNLYKLTDGQTTAISQLRYQAKDAVAGGQDYNNIRSGLHPAATLDWMKDYVDWESWYRYEAVQQAIRHYDLGVYPDRENAFAPADTPALKNIAWYFRPDPLQPLGKLVPLPWDSEQSWGENGAHQGWDMPLYAVIDPQITDGRAKVDYTGGPRQKEELYIGYRNTLREFRDLIWNEEVLPPLIDRYAAIIADIVPADRDRWKDHPFTGGEISDFGPMEDKAEDMKVYAFVGGTHWPVLDRPNTSNVAPGGRALELDERSDYGGDDTSIPDKPTVTAIGDPGFPADDLRFETSDFSDPQGAGTFAALRWRLGEVTDASAPVYDPAADPIYEWTEVWTSGDLAALQNQVQIPSASVEAGHTYRVRSRMKDNTGRWGHWSDPVEFTVAQQATASPGDIIVSEFLGNANGNDDDKEWIELFNTTDTDIDIRGWRILDNETDSHTIAAGAPVTVPSKGYLVLGESSNAAVNGGAPVDYVYNNDITLGNNADEIILMVGDTIVFSLGYGDFTAGPNAIQRTIASPPEGGAALGMSLDYCEGPVDFWVSQISPYGTNSDLGTPGADNNDVEVCAGDMTPPILVSGKLGGKNLVVVEFDEPLDEGSAETLSNYQIDGGIGQPAAAVLENLTQVALTFPTPLDPDTLYTLTVQNVADVSMNPATAEQTAGLFYSIPPVSITEIMYDNRGADIEWIELLNTTGSPIDISGWYLTDDNQYPAGGEGNAVLPPGSVIDPGEYVVINLWSDANFGLWQMPPDVRVIDASASDPGSLSNDGDNLALFDAPVGGSRIDGSLVAGFAPLSQDGQSLEKRDEEFPWFDDIAVSHLFQPSTFPIGFETGLNENSEFLSSFASPGRGRSSEPRPTPTVTATPTITPTPTVTATFTLTATVTPTSSVTPTATESPTPSPTPEVTETPTVTSTRDYDIAPEPGGDGSVDPKDLLVVLDRLQSASEEAEVLFDFSLQWRTE